MSNRLSLIALALSLVGCAGGRTNLKFDGTTYPISLSPTVLGRDGNVLMPEEREVVGQVLITTKAWGILWSSVPLSPNKDVSAEMNEQVNAAGGEAVVNLTVTGDQCGINHAWILSTIPLWPGCSVIHLQGDIIREKPPEARADAMSGEGAP